MRLAPTRRSSLALAVAACAGLISACTTTGEVGGRDDAICVGQGLQAGSADYANCRALLAAQHRDDALVARSIALGDD